MYKTGAFTANYFQNVLKEKDRSFMTQTFTLTEDNYAMLMDLYLRLINSDVQFEIVSDKVDFPVTDSFNGSKSFFCPTMFLKTMIYQISTQAILIPHNTEASSHTF